MQDLPENEVKLVRLAAAGDDDAFCALRDRYARHLRLLIARYAPDPEDRRDLFSEIIARLLHNDKRALRAWEPRAPFAAYLTTIAVRHCIAWLGRRRGLRERIADLQPSGEEGGGLEDTVAAGPEAEPDAALERLTTRKAVHDAVMQLSDSDRLVLAMRFADGLTGAAIAKVLGITHGAARQRIYKALRRLADICEKLDDDLLS
ncbi:MAG: sigma-70 family RNA polymerase sigma factor [Armatimonadota bacterium]|nr:sigma-70 family RNA polymerase sigma factor [Armatimonadota bacterium]